MLISLLAIVSTVAALPTLDAISGNATLSFSQFYDNPNGSLSDVVCSDGRNGMITKGIFEADLWYRQLDIHVISIGYNTFGSLPGFPSIGGIFAITNFNSPKCGTCWEVTYAGTGNSVNILAIDRASTGTFNVTLAAMNTLTNGQAVTLGNIPVTYTQVAPSQCLLVE